MKQDCRCVEEVSFPKKMIGKVDSHPVQSAKYYGVMLSFWAGAATGLGAIIIVALMDWFKQREKGIQGVLAFSLAMAAGVMITVSVVDLWFPLVRVDGLLRPSFAVGLGILGFKLLSKAVSSTTCCMTLHSHHHGHSHSHTSLLPLSDREREEKMAMTAQQRNLKVAAMMFLALTLHNFPEGE